MFLSALRRYLQTKSQAKCALTHVEVETFLCTTFFSFFVKFSIVEVYSHLLYAVGLKQTRVCFPCQSRDLDQTCSTSKQSKYSFFIIACSVNGNWSHTTIASKTYAYFGTITPPKPVINPLPPFNSDVFLNLSITLQLFVQSTFFQLTLKHRLAPLYSSEVLIQLK